MALIKKYTKAPTGLSIARNGRYYTHSWKCADSNYDYGQKFWWRISCDPKGKWYRRNVSASARSLTTSLDLSRYYPTTNKKVTTVDICVRGCMNNTDTYYMKWSGDTYYTMRLYIPPVPGLTAELSENYANRTTFAWTTTTTATDQYAFRDIELQTILVKECTVTDGSRLTWKSGVLGWATSTSGGSSSTTITEDTAILANASYTRWYRVRARGLAGASGWRYAKHVYAKPWQARIKSVSASQSGTTLSCNVKWVADQNAAHPIDSTTVQYSIVVPGSNMAHPGAGSWNDASTTIDTGGDDGAWFAVDEILQEDECLYVRVNNKHDNNIIYGVATLAKAGVLKKPSGLTVQTDNTTHRATVTATNNSSVPDSFLVVLYKSASDPANPVPVGIIPHGSTSTTVQCPDWTGEAAVSFGVYAVAGSYTSKSRSDGVSVYTITSKMTSEKEWTGGQVPVAPTNVTVTQTDILGTVRVMWDWTWDRATSAELSWADHEDAWESTDEPDTYVISNLHAAQWNISGLQTGKTWYVRVRLLVEGEETTSGPWSELVTIDLSSAPAVPSLALSSGIVTAEGSVTASWVYMSTDNTAQAYAEICEATISGSTITYGDVIAHTETAQHVTIYVEDVGWQPGEAHSLCVRTVSASGRESDSWSDPVTVIVVEPLEAVIESTSLQEISIVDSDDAENVRTILALTEMPLTLTVSGAGEGGTTSVIVERAKNYRVNRPDESTYEGFEGETIAVFSQTGESSIEINYLDLIGNFDDDASYRIIAIVRDGLGQTASVTQEFEVHWTNQAVMPEATVLIDNNEMIAVITPAEPENAPDNSYADIYRLSADKPELIYSGAELGTAYVDPYPAIGENGGHRIVFRTAEGDYITEDKRLAWIDLKESESDILNSDYVIIDFNGEQLLIEYNIDFNNSWEKEFTETKYLGGAVQGDWNKGISRSMSINFVAFAPENEEMLASIRRLAAFEGICHVRTPDGSSFAADIQVSEDRSYSTAGRLPNYNFKVTKVDTEGFDAVPLADWNN